MSNTAVLDENGIATVAGGSLYITMTRKPLVHTPHPLWSISPLGWVLRHIRAPMHRRRQFQNGVTWFAGLPR